MCRHEAKFIQLIVKKISKTLFPDKVRLIGLQTRLGDMQYGGGGMISIPPPSHEELKRSEVPLHEIILATKNFSKDNIIGKGGFGFVYQGESEKLGKVAVKKLDRKYNQGDRQFMMEIALLSAYKHEKLVSLVGYCDQDEHKILVLKYEMNRSLDEHIRCEDLTWIQRLRICLDAAKGLKYLHEDIGAQHRILHRDIKSSNILLDEN
ncbi:putative serine/threonine-protein kinase PBL23 [Bidens hawaiensis]|uniref:putative serine/threonine-protein kinase PBL23 n=1 Tax=Bidens hawaiensis TaxID=980011 RepID=UPI00404B1F3A